jgi:hypothetical protein
MFSEQSTFGSILILLGYLLAAFVLVCAVVLTLFTAGILSEGKAHGGSELQVFDYIQWIGGSLWFWSSFVALVALAQLLRTGGSVRWCRVLAGYLCLLIPVGTVFGALVFVYLGTRAQKDESHAA